MNPSESAWSNLLIGKSAIRLMVICYGSALFAFNSLVAYTVMPSAVLDLEALPLISWTTTISVVAAILGSASGGIVATALGARFGYLAATVAFLAGAGLSAASPNFILLLAGRALQGAGGGVILALNIGILREYFPASLWPKVFAMNSVMWGLAAIFGPMLGGLSVQWLTWRWAFLALALMALCYLPLLWAGLPTIRSIPHKGFPFGRLLALGTGILIIAATGNIDSGFASVFLLISATVLILMVLRLDSGKGNKLFPKEVFNPATVMGTGVWMVLTLMMGTISFAIYGPILLQQIHGISPLKAGYFVSLETASWTLAALFVANLPAKFNRSCIVAGPMLTALGLLGISGFLANGPLSALAVFVCFSGAGIGICWSFVGREIIAAAEEGEQGLVASVIPATQMGGLALGSAIAGIVANGLGFMDGATLTVIETVAVRLPLAFLVPLVVAIIMGLRLAIMMGRKPPEVSTRATSGHTVIP